MSNNLIQNLNCSDVYRAYTLLLTADKDSLETNTTLKQLAGFVGEELDNYKKSKSTSDLMDLFEDNFIKLADDDRVHRYGIKVKVLGQRELIPANVLEAIEVAEEKTKDYSDHYYNIALAYGSRQEIIHAIKQIAQKVKDGEMEIEDICEDTVSTYLYTADFPDPDLVLRTSGEERVSNFLLWQLAYSELYFTDVYWPGFRKIDFLRAIRSYQLRQRRFGT